MKNWFASDKVFNSLYPKAIQDVAEKHWTPLAVAEKAAAFLAVSADEKVLDVGSGSGKFCLTAAHYHPLTLFYGIEQRANLVALSTDIAQKLQLENVTFICNNISNVDFKDFGHFYFYNSFYENISLGQKIDDEVEYSEALYNYYCNYLNKELEKMPAGTRVATFQSLEHEMPASYRVMKTGFHGSLKFWTKV